MHAYRGQCLVLVIAALLGLTLVLAPVSGAAAASVTGTVRDHSGIPVPHLTLRAENHTTPGPTIEAETAPDGSYTLPLVPGNYTLSIFVGKAISGLPPGWALETAQFTVSGDETRDITLPPTATVTVEALGAGDPPIAGAGVDLSELLSSANLGGYPAAELRSRELTGVTDSQGRLSLVVFDHGTFTEAGSITPSPGSGYGFTRFSSPPVSGNTTIVVHPVGENEPPAVIETRPEGPGSSSVAALLGQAAAVAHEFVRSIQPEAEGHLHGENQVGRGRCPDAAGQCLLRRRADHHRSRRAQAGDGSVQHEDAESG